jgi:hypothetical protein
VDGMNFAWWPPNLTNVTLCSSKKKSLKNITPIQKKMYPKQFFALCPPNENYMLEVNVPIHEKQKLYLLNYKELSTT